MPAHSTATAAQAWAALSRHARDEIAPLRLQELCRDNDRVSSLVAVYNTSSESSSVVVSENDQPSTTENRILIADLSRQRMTLETLNHLLKLASAKKLRRFITQLAWGQNDPRRPILPARARGKQAQNHTSRQRTATTQHEPPERKTARFEAVDESASNKGPSTTGIMPSSTFDTVPTFVDASSTTAPSMHIALRVPAGKSYEMLTADGNNVLTGIHREWTRIEIFSEAIRHGQLRGVSGSMIRDVVVIGRGVPIAALKFVYSALLRDERSVLATRFGLMEAAAARIRNLAGSGGTGRVTRRLHFLSRVDPITAASVVADLDPASTLVISIALNGNEETGLATKILKSWLLQALGNNRRPELVLAKHMVLVTGNDHIASVINKPESVHVIPDHSRCEPFLTFSACTLLPLSIVFGWPLVEEFLAGAHDMDKHFIETNPRHSLPVLLALTDVWNDTLLGASCRVMTPFSEAFSAFPAFVAALEAQTCSKSVNRGTGRSCSTRTCASLVMDGGVSGSYDRSLYQSDEIVNSELVAVMDSQVAFNTSRTIGVGGMDDVHATQDTVLCSLFAHCDELAFGSEKADSVIPSSVVSNSTTTRANEGEQSEGNRPSLLLICGKLDAFACGQLIALAEHRAVVKAHIWGIDPFVRVVGSSLRMYRTDLLKDELQYLFSKKAEETEEEGAGSVSLSLSTKTLLEHYAAQMRDKRMYTAK